MNQEAKFSIPGIKPSASGKVRDIYDLGDRLLLVATDRISAFDMILPQAIPSKGSILTSLSHFWFQLLSRHGYQHHLISCDAAQLPDPYRAAVASWGPRIMLVEKLEMFPVECVARGYLAGSGWKEYQKTGTVCGIALPPGLAESAELPAPIFTPATKAKDGHDINISFEEACTIVGSDVMTKLRTLTLGIYQLGRDYARERGVILADTKFEFGHRPGSRDPVLADEVLTPDSSRYWEMSGYRTGISPPSFDKQFVRNFLVASGWKDGMAPTTLTAEVITGTLQRYAEIYHRISGKKWS